MELTSVTTTVDDVAAARDFYGTVLGLTVSDEGSDGAVEVRVGSTLLRLQRATPAGVCDHLAFTIPADAFAAAKAWLARRVPLLTTGGQDEFEGSPAWDSRSLYFPGPSRSVLELIARRRLTAHSGGTPFGPEQLLCVSEVGIAVPDVAAAVRALAAVGQSAFGGPPGADFAAVGDDHGLLILASPGRPWMPTADRTSVSSALSLTAVGTSLASLRLGHAEVELVASAAA